MIVLAPFGSDALVICRILAASGIACATASTVTELVDHVRTGAGAVLLTEEALRPTAVAELCTAVAAQPSWSDLPIVLLLAGDDGAPSRAALEIASLRMAGNVTLLQRPIPALTIVSAAQASLRARARQYEVRDLLARERRAREQVEAAMRIKDEFLATISHELRTPLGAILLWSQLLESGRLTEQDRRDAITAITTSARAQSQLVEDLLDVSRMLMGRLRLELQPHALAPIAAAALEVVRPTAEAKGVQLDAELAGEDDVVLIDPARAQQILWNLLHNAVKFTPRGGTVSLHRTCEGDHALLTVTDTGEGIDAALLPHVFEPFRQGDPRAAHGGLGLGLSIVRQLVELHGGTIEAHSAGRGHGARFVVRLPLSRA